MPIRRYTSRTQRLDQSFLTARLAGARAYDRIAGYFRSSILEVAGEAIENLQGVTRVICNSDLSPADVQTAKAAQEAMRRDWCAGEPEQFGDTAGGQRRFQKLYELLHSGKLQVRVLPDAQFGFVHGKAGIITLANGSQTAFMGSANESKTAWRMNYELLWEDDSPDAIAWTQAEFDALWGSPHAVPLAQAVIADIERISRRTVIPGVDDWKQSDTPDPAAPIIESPVYRRDSGLWEHQKYFVNLAFEAHQTPQGARFVLADQVGLGKTIQLAMAAELMALQGDKPVLVLAPKPLIWQWQEELRNLLDMPSAVWDGKDWWDENEVRYPSKDDKSICECPRRVGIVSTGLVTRQSNASTYLRHMEWECVILDEAHRARRQHLIKDHEYDDNTPNNLLRFVQHISSRTKSLLLATATPVQLHPIETWDLLEALNRKDGAVLGTFGSKWLQPELAIPLLMGTEPLPTSDLDMWDWIRTPMPPASEDRDYDVLRKKLGMTDEKFEASSSDFNLKLTRPDWSRIKRIFPDHINKHNPFIRHIVRRTRQFLETENNPETNEPYLRPVRVELHGERTEDAITLPPFLEDAYTQAETFCQLLGQRTGMTGFLRTLLLRRVGSTIEAGRLTARRMLNETNGPTSGPMDEDDDEQDEVPQPITSTGLLLQADEKDALRRFVDALEANQESDPKLAVIRRLLLNEGWLTEGCIIFSQYYDSVWWLAQQLSRELPEEPIAIYSGSTRSGILRAGIFNRTLRDDIKTMVREDKIRLMIGTDAASEGLNLQRLGRLINLDLPWNPTRLEQRKGRIQRIGQMREVVHVYNMRYRGSVEDRVHDLLSQRLEAITGMFGQLPDTLEDVWVDMALGNIADAKKTIGAIPERHPFEMRYDQVKPVNWESCATVLNSVSRKQYLSRGWG